jgi:hypothetical protein
LNYDVESDPSLEIYNGPITSISSKLDVDNTKIVLGANRVNNGIISFSVVQNPQDIGYNSYRDIFKSDEQTHYYNIDFNLGDPCWFKNDNPIILFTAIADGIKPTLYTVVDLNNPISKVNSRRVYKYESLNSVNGIDSSLDTLQSISLVFRSRKYCDVPVVEDSTSISEYAENATWNYLDRLLITTVDSSSITWSEDTSFTDNVYVSWAFGNSETATKMPTDLFYVENEGRKWVYITLLPFQTMLNQYGLTVSEIAWDGSLYTPLVTTRVLSLQPGLSNPALSASRNYEIEQYSVSSLHQ